MPVSEAKPTAAPKLNPALHGIALKVASVCSFMVMVSLLKAAQGIPTGELVFFRSFFGIIPVIAVLAWKRELLDGLKTSRLGGHLWRGVVGTLAMVLNFYALTQLPLPEAVTLNYAMPLMIVVLSALMLGEVVRLHRWSAVVIGFVGVLIIAWPRLTLFSDGAANAAAIGVLAAIGGAAAGATAQVLVGTLVRTERSATVVLYFLIASAVLSLLTLPFGWVMPDPRQAVLLIGAGIAGGIGQVLVTESYRRADLSVVAPFEYSSLLISVVVGYSFFGDVPTPYMWVGGIIVVASGLFIIYRERRLKIARPELRNVTPDS